jgi:type-F conjugative transfer system pilin assembly protein TrbC
MKKLLILLLFPVMAISSDNLTEKYIQELKGVKLDNISEDMLKAAEGAYQTHIEKAVPKADSYFSGFDISGDNMTFGADNASRHIFNRTLAATDRLYVFMSSSVPLTVWKNYTQSLKKTKNAVIVLRGCIGGCSPDGFKQTTAFLRSLDNISAIIDPMLYRLYNITEVPTFIYASGVPNLDIGSEGNLSLLPGRTIPNHRKSTGDWSLDYHLEQLGLKE